MKKYSTRLCLIFLLTIIATVQIQTFPVGAQDTLEMTVATNKPEYNQRDYVAISGSLRYGIQPVSDVLVALQVDDPRNDTIIYRALPTGGTPTLDGIIEIQELVPIDLVTELPKIYFKVGSQSKFRVTIKNNGPETMALITLTIFDGNMVPIGGATLKTSISSGSVLPITFTIPIDSMWAYIGPAKAVANVFTDYPSDGGVPRCLEASASFGIVRGAISTSSVPPPPQETPPQPGTFNNTFRFGPEPLSGIYTVYTSARKEGLTALQKVLFQVKSSRLDVPSPPQASFTFTPLKAYVKAPVNFDASASTPENTYDTITRYEWNWGDGSPKSSTTYTSFSHTFNTVGAYNVTLKVTDNDSWCTTTKPVTIRPPDPPVANFTWSPNPPVMNNITTFNASTSQLGWNGTHNVPIVSYKWDFGDGNITTVAVPVIYHKYALYGTLNVTLTITDSGSLQSSKTYTINVAPPITRPPGPPIADFTWSPNPPVMNHTAKFDASISLPGWNGTHSFPIVSYRWDFGDGNVTTVTVSVIYHKFAQNITYNVTLNVTDTRGEQSGKTYAIKVSSFLVGDVNSDGKVDGKDIALAAKAFGARPGSPLWDPRADVNNDGKIDGKDIAIIAKHFGERLISGLAQSYTNASRITFKITAIASTTSPPQASFTFSPLKKYAKVSVIFDASASSPENFEDIITSYEWYWGDGTPKDTTTIPYGTHKFLAAGAYNVTLKVTDNDGWCSTTKPITVSPPDPPKADFTWWPNPPIVNRTTKFDASASTLGWNGTHRVPIVSYKWDFGDGNITTVAVRVIYHTYAQNITYNATLTIVDYGGLQSSKTYTIKVEARLIGDVNGDAKVDGKDIAIAARAFGATPGSPLWDPRADVNNDGKIDGKDIAIIARHFGEHA